MKRCADCSATAPPDCARCDACRELHNARERRRRAERKARKQCWVCGGKAVQNDTGGTKSVCAAHEGSAWRAA